MMQTKDRPLFSIPYQVNLTLKGMAYSPSNIENPKDAEKHVHAIESMYAEKLLQSLKTLSAGNHYEDISFTVLVGKADPVEYGFNTEKEAKLHAIQQFGLEEQLKTLAWQNTMAQLNGQKSQEPDALLDAVIKQNHILINQTAFGFFVQN